MVTVVMVEKRPADIRAPERRPAKSPRTRSASSARAATMPAPAPVTPVGSVSGADAADGTNARSSLVPELAITPLSANERFRRISVNAYFKAEQRGFEPGHMWEDWLAAEREVDAAPMDAREPAPGN